MSFNKLIFLSFFCLLKSSHANTVTLESVLFSGDYEFLDLSYPFDNETVYWPGNKDFQFTKKTGVFMSDHSWYAANEFAAAEHGGTHLDAPFHFFQMGQHVSEIPLEKLIVPMILFDISSKVKDNPNYILYKGDLDNLDSLINYHVGKNCVIVFKFGWSKYYTNIQQYMGFDKHNKTKKFPGLSAEVAEWIISYKNVVGIGVDVASVDPGSSDNFPVHKILSKNGLYNMENVYSSRSLPDLGCIALVMPMKIADSTGAPLRLVAICPKKILKELD